MGVYSFNPSEISYLTKKCSLFSLCIYMPISYLGGDETENSKRQGIHRLTCTKAAEEKEFHGC